MPCIDVMPCRLLRVAMLVPVLTACGSWPPALQTAPAAAPAPAATVQTAPASPAPPAAVPPSPVAPPAPPLSGVPSPHPVPSPAPATPSAAVPRTAAKAPATVPPPKRRFVPLGPPASARNWDEFRQQAARRLVQSNPDGTYTGAVPEPLLAIPVLEVELNADGSVRRVHVLRHPRQARDTTQMAIDAVHRAAPYGSMTRLPHPWKWAEVFLFDDDRRFKPRELDK